MSSLEMCERVKEIWRKANAVCFDVDSTVIIDEGIDELATFCGAGEKVKAWTIKAMSGSVSFRESLKARLEIINPSFQQLEDFVARHPPRLSPGVQDLVALLHSQNKHVFLISGGFYSLINPIAKILNIPLNNISANRILFDEDGNYLGFDESEPTSNSHGKAVAVGRIKEKHQLAAIVMIGDGATDMEASPPADAFIGYGGNVTRDKVKANSPWFVTDFHDLIRELQCGEEQNDS